MSDDRQTALPSNLPDVCYAEQPAKDDAAACLVQPPPKDDAACPVLPPNYEAEMSDVVLLKDDDAPPPNDDTIFASMPNDDAVSAPMPNIDDGAASLPVENASPASPPVENASPASPPVENASPASPPVEHASPASPPVEDASPASPPVEHASPASPPVEHASPASPPVENASPASPPVEHASPASPPVEDASPPPLPLGDVAHPACQLPLPLDEAVPLAPRVEPGFSRANGLEDTNRSDKGVIVKQEIKHETIDLGNDTFYYDDNNQTILVKDPKVGFDRGLEPDHIVGATEMNGKLMFLIAWKNSEVADLLESTEVYNKCPQLAIQFFEARLKYCPNDQKN